MAPLVVFGPRASAKAVLHAAKYPHSSILGLLLSDTTDVSTTTEEEEEVRISDVLPLFHQSPRGLSPSMEVALAHVQALVSGTRMRIAGVYHANERLDNASVDVFAQRVADKLATLNRGDDASKLLLVTLDNVALANEDAPKDVFIVRSKSTDTKEGNEDVSKWHLESMANVESELSPEALAAMMDRGLHRDLVDFDNHLDKLDADLLNVAINMDIDNVLVQAC